MDNNLLSNNQEKDFESRLSAMRKDVKESTGIDMPISRGANADFAFPSNEQEYIDLCGSALGLITSKAINKEELPIEQAYFLTKKQVEIPLRQIVWEGDDGFFCRNSVLADKMVETKEDCFVNFSLWQAPMMLFLDDDAILMIDFKGERKAFSVMRGPWNIDEKNKIYIQKQQEKSIIVNKEFKEDNFLCKFVEREFGHLFGQ